MYIFACKHILQTKLSLACFKAVKNKELTNLPDELNEDFYTSISTYIGIVNINGYNINLEKMTNDDIKITGKIESVELERVQD